MKECKYCQPVENCMRQFGYFRRFPSYHRSSIDNNDEYGRVSNHNRNCITAIRVISKLEYLVLREI